VIYFSLVVLHQVVTFVLSAIFQSDATLTMQFNLVVLGVACLPSEGGGVGHAHVLN